jgi:hypothetical protein
LNRDRLFYRAIKRYNLRQIKRGRDLALYAPGQITSKIAAWEVAMAQAAVSNPDPLAGLPTAKDLMKQIALKEAEKASAAMNERTAAEAEKHALIEKFSKPSGVSDEDRMMRAAAIIKRAAANGLTEVFVFRFPNELCTDRGRAINQNEAGWEKTLTGLPKELFAFFEQHLKPRGYHVAYQIVDFPGGMPGDVGVTLKWS